jgi:hypothetical protein
MYSDTQILILRLLIDSCPLQNFPQALQCPHTHTHKKTGKGTAAVEDVRAIFTSRGMSVPGAAHL